MSTIASHGTRIKHGAAQELAKVLKLQGILLRGVHRGRVIYTAARWADSPRI